MASDKFFSNEYLDQLNPQQQEEQEPVTVFGLTFKNDEERRQYFRDELRRRLPELRKIEGFPIGEDDDIINLSDPPYFTACPNPWLNDFIKEWEEEKKQLQLEGKRKADFDVKEPYASDVSEGKNNPIYMAHAYHTKCPHPAIMRYILHYTQPGDIVFDGFAGTGMTGVAAHCCGHPTSDLKSSFEADWKKMYGSLPEWGERIGICSDLSPYATSIAHSYNISANISNVTEELNRIYKEVEEECGWMYKTKHDGIEGKINNVVWSDICRCPQCGEEFSYWDVAKDDDNKCLRDEFNCPSCGIKCSKSTIEKVFETKFDKAINLPVSLAKIVPALLVGTNKDKRKFERVPGDYDLELINQIEEIDYKYAIPTQILPNGYNIDQPKRSDNILRVYQFYTKRNLYTLSCLYDKIKKSRYSHNLLFIFTSMISRSTKMNRFSPRNYFYGGGGWCLTGLSGSLYVPYLPMEVSVLEQLKGKLNLFNAIKEHLPRYCNNVVSVSSATALTLPNNAVDYIFVDPPFGANIMYSDLNIIAESWLRVRTNDKEEAIVNEYQHKDLFEYQRLMNNSFKEFYRVLKPGKWLTMEFSNTSASVWNSIQNALQGVGFVVANVAALDKKQGSFKAVTTTTAVKQDLVITCYKPSNVLQEKFLQLGGNKDNVWDFIGEHLLHLPVHIEKGNATTSVVERSPKILFDRLISYYVQKGYAIPMDAQEFQKGLRERYVERDGMYFTPVQAAEYEEKKLKAPEFVPMGIMVSDEANGIEWLKNELRDNPQTRQDIYTNWRKAVAGVRKGDVIPELDTLLEENFIQNEDGTWRLANVEDDVDLEKLRTKALLKEFKLYLEVCRKPRGKLKDVRVEAVRAGFKQCYSDKNFADIILVGDRIPQNLLTEDEVLLQYYDIASSKV